MKIKVIIIGAGGHGQVVADILLQMKASGAELEPIGYLDDNPREVGKVFLGLSVLGPLEDLQLIPHAAVIVAIGENRTRERIFKLLERKGERFITAQHPRATIAPDVRVHPGCMIMAGAVVNSGSVIGKNSILNTNCSVDHHCYIGDHVHVAPGSNLGGGVKVGEGVLIGIGSTILPRQKIGPWSIIGAGSLVRDDVTEGTTVAGVPASRIIGK